MKPLNIDQRLQTVIFLYLLLFITALLYWQGLNSPFIFDDIPNLSPMGQHQTLGFWQDFALFILQGDSGPTGRPISLASFYLNDYAWPEASAADFKYTNLMLHLLNGVLIFWLSLKTSTYLKLSESRKKHFALLTSALWLVHPIQINTVLYVVQRMTELSALFILTGLLCYLHGRKLLPKKPVKAWLWLLAGGTTSLLMAMLSKENGILLVVYILAIEYFLLRPHNAYTTRSLNLGLYLAAWGPFILILGFLGKVAWNNEGYAARPFTLEDRLLTEPRIIWDYLVNIILPNLQGSSLFHDDYMASTSWLSPPETLVAIIGLLILIITMFALRLRQPVIAFAITWFLGGHLLESTTISLELYFEHRNYLPLYGPVFALTYYCFKAYEQSEKLKNVLSLGLASYCLLVLVVSYQGVQRWTDPVQMIVKWAEDHPKSQRTLESLDVLIGDKISQKTRNNLQKELLKISQDNNTSSYLVLRELLLKCRSKTLTATHMDQSLQALSSSGFVASAPKVYADFISQWLENSCGDISAEKIIAFSQNLSNINNLKHGEMQNLIHYWQAEIQVKQGNLRKVMEHHEAAYNIKPTIDSLLLQANYLSSAGLYKKAINKLELAQSDLCTSKRKCLILEIRQPELDTFMQILKKRLKEQKESDNHEKIVHHSTS